MFSLRFGSVLAWHGSASGYQGVRTWRLHGIYPEGRHTESRRLLHRWFLQACKSRKSESRISMGEGALIRKDSKPFAVPLCAPISHFYGGMLRPRSGKATEPEIPSIRIWT